MNSLQNFFNNKEEFKDMESEYHSLPCHTGAIAYEHAIKNKCTKILTHCLIVFSNTMQYVVLTY